MRIASFVFAVVLGMMVSLSALAGEAIPQGEQTFFGPNGAPLALGFVYLYVPKTSTPKLSWQDSGLSVPNGNPIQLDANGQARLWGNPNDSYREVVQDMTGALVWDQIVQLPGACIGPASTIVGHLVTWASSSGCSLGGDPLIAVNVNDLDLQPGNLTALSSLNSNYFSNFAQTTATRLKLGLTGSISDSTGSFQDALYIELTDTDTTTTYTLEHNDYALRVALFGPQGGGGAYSPVAKNLVAFNAYAEGATTGVGSLTFAPGVSGINADAFQYGAGIGDNEFAAHQIASSSAHSVSLAAVQAIIDSDYAAADSTHTAYAVLASNIGTQPITAVYAYSGNGTQASFLQAGGATVTKSAIVMPHSATSNEGSIIDYGQWNGAPAGGSYSWWSATTHNGQYGWTDNGNIVLRVSLDEGLFVGVGTAMATTAVGPFVSLTNMAGTPTGTPVSAAFAGESACVVDTTAVKLWCYDNVAAAWKWTQLN